MADSRIGSDYDTYKEHSKDCARIRISILGFFQQHYSQNIERGQAGQVYQGVTRISAFSRKFSNCV